MSRDNCLRCGHPKASGDDWRTVLGGERADLCWGNPCEPRLPIIKTCRGCVNCGTHLVGFCIAPGQGKRIDPDQPPPSWCPLRVSP